DGFAGSDLRVNSIFNWRSLPEIDIARLVAAGDKNRLRLPNDFGDARFQRRLAIWNDERCNGVCLAQAGHIRVVVGAAMRSNNEKVAAVRLAAQPAESFIQIGTAAHHRNPEIGTGLSVVRVTGANVFEIVSAA